MNMGKLTKNRFKPSVLAISIGVFSQMTLVAGAKASVDPNAPNIGGAEVRDSYALLEGVVQVDGIRYSVDSAAMPESYSVRNNGVLNILPGALVDHVFVSAAEVNIDGGEVRDGLAISKGRGIITGATIKSVREQALMLLRAVSTPDVPSTANITSSQLIGAGYGALVSDAGVLTLDATFVEGVGTGPQGANAGIALPGGVVYATNGSHVIGDDRGFYIYEGTDGYSKQKNILVIDGSTVTARLGSAIDVTEAPGTVIGKTKADIRMNNHSTLEAGNGRLIDVTRESTANVNVNNSQLTGNFVADETSTLNVELHNHARLDGNIINSESLVIDSSGHWQLADDNTVKSLAMDGGSVGLSNEGFHTLNVAELSGRGRFDMRINLDNLTGDLLNVTGTATGRYVLNVQNTGVEAVPGEFDALKVVHTESGNAEFRLRGGRADLGVYSYALEQQGSDWFIVGSGKIISPSTQSALALFNVGPTIWNSELNTLRSRMGEVRGQEQGGGWIRSYGSRFKASLDSGVDYQQRQHGMSFGADAPVSVSNGQLLVGLMAGYSQSALDMGRGTSGEVDSYYLGAYGTWQSDEGYYLDGVLKVNQFHNASKVAMSDGEKAKGDYSNMAVGGSVEFGKRIALSDDYFVAPYAQLSSVWIEGSRYTLDNGMQANTSQTQSVLGKVGATVGRQFTLKDGGVVQPYIRVAAAHEFSRNEDVSVNDQRFDNDLFGSRAELGAGVSVSLSKRLQVHADFDYMKGKQVEQPWGANVGLRLSF